MKIYNLFMDIHMMDCSCIYKKYIHKIQEKWPFVTGGRPSQTETCLVIKSYS